MIKVNININLSCLKIIGMIVVLAGLWGFIYGMINDVYVADAIAVITLGLSTLGYRKHLITKTNENSSNKKTISE